MKKRHIIEYLKNPSTWDSKAFETSMRQEVETLRGDINATDELLIGSLILTVDALVSAQSNILELGLLYEYNSGSATSPWYKIRTEMIDKSIKLLTELSLTSKLRTPTKQKISEIDELFESA